MLQFSLSFFRPRGESDKLKLDPKRFRWCKNMYKKTSAGCSYVTSTPLRPFSALEVDTLLTWTWLKQEQSPLTYQAHLHHTLLVLCVTRTTAPISAVGDENAGVKSDNGWVVHTLMRCLFVGRLRERQKNNTELQAVKLVSGTLLKKK